MAMSVVLIALALVVLPGVFLPAREDDFFLAGRRSGTPAVAASLVALCLGASTTIGLVGRAYRMGWAAFWWLGAASFGLVVLGLVWAVPMRSSPRTRSLPQWLETAYGMPARLLSAGLIVIMWTAVVAAQWVAAGRVLEFLLDWPLVRGILVAAVAVTLYTAWGGQRAVLRTDIAQVVLVFLGIATALALTRHVQASIGSVAVIPAPVSGRLSLLQWMSLLVVVGGMYVVGPDLCTRVLLARDDRAARHGAVAAGIILLPCAVAIVGTAMALRSAGVCKGNLHAVLSQCSAVHRAGGYAVAAGLLAAMLSSADTCLLTAATVVELDLVGRGHRPERQRFFARVFVCAVGLISAAVACLHREIIPNLLLAYAFYSGGLLLPLLCLAFPRVSAWIPLPCVWCAMGVGGSTPVALILTGKVQDFAVAGLWGVLVCLGVLLAGAVSALLLHERQRPSEGTMRRPEDADPG